MNDLLQVRKWHENGKWVAPIDGLPVTHMVVVTDVAADEARVYYTGNLAKELPWIERFRDTVITGVYDLRKPVRLSFDALDTWAPDSWEVERD